MKLSEAIGKLQKLKDQHGNLQFACNHNPRTCRVDKDSWVPCMEIVVLEMFNGELKVVVAK